MIMPRSFLLLSFLIYKKRITYAWQKWNYETETTDEWRQTWNYPSGPRGRRAGTFVTFNSTKILLFGGRDNDLQTVHVPSTYELIDEDGVLKFTTYENKPIEATFGPNCAPIATCFDLGESSTGEEEICTYKWNIQKGDASYSPQSSDKDVREFENTCGFVPVGQYYNDVWVYDLNCTRYSDMECFGAGWRVIHPGKKFGGCRDENTGSRVCDLPSERWHHGAAKLGGAMIIYGGFSHECDDYCDDMWSFDLETYTWTELFPIRSSIDTSISTPGKRWKFSLIGDIYDSITSQPILALFGGHRLWKMGLEDHYNSSEADGGYLDDLWIYSEDSGDITGYTWKKKRKKESCKSDPGPTWESRYDQSCNIYWPKARAGHSLVYDRRKDGIYLFGGFTSYSPYFEGHGGTKEGSFAPYPSLPYFFNDLWFYDLRKGYWNELKPRTKIKPTGRAYHMTVISESILILFGGYGNTNYFNDTWYYYIDEGRWLQKDTFVHADYPETCTDDLSNENCTKLNFPKLLKRSGLPKSYEEILPFRKQQGFTPITDDSHYFGVLDDAYAFVEDMKQKFLSNEVLDEKGTRVWLEVDTPEGTPVAPYAATGPRQFAQLRRIPYNGTMIEVWEWCVTGRGEPTRGGNLDGRFGRSTSRILIPQPKRKSPGWDGCRELDWKYPNSRAEFAFAFLEEQKEIIIYGGVGVINHGESLDLTQPFQVNDDMWLLALHNCVNNCTGQGICSYGFCTCDPGYYGIDCSNHTCPGSVCFYDENHLEVCTHCCHDGYKHLDNDVYNPSIQKASCSRKLGTNMFTGQSEGICDGFGACQCAPPFIGEDCSIKDCKNDCNFNGYCSVEYPVSRCICNPGYFGEYCQFLQCLNNCSHPNGMCDHATGECSCSPIFSPYDRLKVWAFWEGEDCSFLTPWCGAIRLMGSILITPLVSFVVELLLH